MATYSNAASHCAYMSGSFAVLSLTDALMASVLLCAALSLGLLLISLISLALISLVILLARYSIYRPTTQIPIAS